ncbi:unnamed protein product [Cuscuta campestris]|uniref:Replication protein A 70 kDa DNA-binding subunit B/D first OB fold domain-containing protein n=1 Tax=Cuscuta campestris TaxID=132261 RepID=A0A484N8R0_9ASTE|nr:unnamed protein product [Cuscuta campestris]
MFAPISDLYNTKKLWILMLRAVRVYFVPRWAKGGDSMEIIFYDENGNRIHAHLNRPERIISVIQSQPCLNDQLLIDVIGKIVARTSVQTNSKRGFEQKLMEVTLEDHEGNRLGCTLWGEYVDRFMDCLTQNNQEAVIMLLSFCRPRRYMGYL